jgi:zinc protease
MPEDALRIQLDNGLLLLLKEIHTAPLISQWVWYRVGSRDERPGLTGLSHWVEHMQFRGTPTFPPGLLDRAIAREGGFWNASTFLDWTAYLETLPSAKIDLALQLEADRMQYSLFEPADVEAERSVIISERQGSENEPMFLLSEAVHAAAFQVHPYRNDVIGSLADLESIQREDLYRHYRSYYVPGNAVISLAGDFEAQDMAEHLQRIYQAIPAGAPVPRAPVSEPPLAGESRVEVTGPGETIYLEAAYRAPPANHPDFWALSVLDSLLCGASTPSVFGGGISNKTSRLYRALVDGELAVGISGGLLATLDPYLFSITAVLRSDSQPEAALAALDAEVLRLQDTPPSTAELSRAVKQARALFAYSSESITHQAAWIGLAEMLDSPHWFDDYLNQITAVTPQDVQQVAQRYLLTNNRVLGIYLPDDQLAMEAAE